MSHLVEALHIDELVAVVTFSDAARGNQLCWAAVDEIAAALRGCREAGARVLVLASGLPGHWLEHAWLHDLIAGVRGEALTGAGSGWFEVQQELGHEDVASIAAVSGDCSGGGAEIGWACDFRIAERQVRFCQPEIDLGLSTGIGGCSRLARLAGGSLATEMVMTGRPVSARRLYECGAVNRVVDTGLALEEALELAQTLANKPPAALAALKRTLTACLEQSLPQALAAEQEVFQSVVTSDEAFLEMSRVQARYDAGESVAEVGDYEKYGKE